ncbi:MAG TPA: VOC family protein [Microthrixaceae bacterium]|nr:VOC family protein [Microthrixaceae bacterium]
MGFHHIAVAMTDTAATHAFYTEAMGFELVKAVVAPTPEGGWAKHVFYDTGGDGLIAFWELHDDKLPERGGLSTAAGLPDWVNHIAFRAHDESHFELCKKRWLDLGAWAFEIDHGFCRSLYTHDPSGTLVEWCLDTRPLDDDDRAHAASVLLDPVPPMEEPPTDAVFHDPTPGVVPPWVHS